VSGRIEWKRVGLDGGKGARSTPTAASSEHNKKNFTFVHCQSQILKRTVVVGEGV